MYDFKTILEASVASFCETIYTYESLDSEEFGRTLFDLLVSTDLHAILVEDCMDIDFDIMYIQNVYNNSKWKNESFETDKVMNYCLVAFDYTTTVDKTINVEAFVDNLVQNFSNK